MKNNKTLIVIVLLLAVAGGWLYFTKSSSTIVEELRDFSVKDTSKVIKIFIADKSGKQSLLEKQEDGSWMINKKLKARPDAIATLLTTIRDVEVRSPVGKNGYNTVIKNIASTGIKVEIYDSNGMIKTFYVGGPTQDHLGTFMYLENSTVPFVTHIPGFDGYLTPRFTVDETDWSEKSVFRVSLDNFKSLSVTDREKTEKTFAISAVNKGSYSVTDQVGKEIAGISQDKVIDYLGYYKNLNYEQKERSLSLPQHDSILGVIPFRTVVFTDGQNNVTTVDLWRRPITESTLHKSYEDGTTVPFDVDRMTASINKDTSLIVVQYYSFEKIFRAPTDFLMVKAPK